MPRVVRIGTFERPRSGQLSPACCSDDLARDLLQWLGCVDHHGPETPISLLDDQAPAKGRAKLLGMLAELVRGPSGQSVAQGALVHDQAYHPIEERRDTVLVLEPPAQLTDARENVPGERLHRVRLDSPGKLLQPAGGGPVRRIHDRFTRGRLTHQLKTSWRLTARLARGFAWAPRLLLTSSSTPVRLARAISSCRGTETRPGTSRNQSIHEERCS